MKLALGTVQFGSIYGVANTSGRVTLQESRDILQHAHASGMDTLDTAIVYGESEVVLGQLGIGQWKVITKLPAVPEGCDDVAKWVQDQIFQSRTRLGVVQLDGVLLHRPSQLLGRVGPALYNALQSIKAEGLTRRIGVSIYEPSELDALMDSYSLDLVQAPMNILDRRIVDSGWAKRLHEAGVDLHVRSAFLQGLLLMPSDQRPIRFNRWNDIWSAWDNWLLNEGVSPIQACLRYFNDIPQIERVVIGVDSTGQLNQILDAYEGKLFTLPDFPALKDDRLINPSTWNNL